MRARPSAADIELCECVYTRGTHCVPPWTTQEFKSTVFSDKGFLEALELPPWKYIFFTFVEDKASQNCGTRQRCVNNSLETY